MSEKDGGPAFPSVLPNIGSTDITGFKGEPLRVNSTAYYGGISMRDYFAAKAMHAMISNGLETRAECKAIPSAAYAFADAMLAERDK